MTTPAIDGTRQSSASTPSATVAGKATSPRATGGQMTPASAMAIGVMAVKEPDGQVERAARSIGEQHQPAGDRPAHDERDGDQPELEPAGPHRRSLVRGSRRPSSGLRKYWPRVGTAGSSSPAQARRRTCRVPHRTHRPGGEAGTGDTWDMAGQAQRGSPGTGDHLATARHRVGHPRRPPRTDPGTVADTGAAGPTVPPRRPPARRRPGSSTGCSR